MAGQPEAAHLLVSRRQGFGCFALAAFSLAVAALCIVLGVMCLAKHGAFDCIGLWTVFPAAFLAVGAVSAVVGLQRFTSARAERAAAPALGTERQVFGPGSVIQLPGRSTQEPAGGTGDSSTREDGAT